MNNSDRIALPDGVTKEERLTDWQKIAEISDEDFGFTPSKEKTGQIRFCVRIILRGDNNQICVVKSEKYGYMQLPGGGIEDGESIEEALRRETEEETGFLISDIKPIGYTVERREDSRNIYQWDKDISFVFEATPTKNIGTKYIDDEIAVGFFPMWINVDEFIEKQEQNSENIESYSGYFSNRRDLLIAKHFCSMCKNNIKCL